MVLGYFQPLPQTPPPIISLNLVHKDAVDYYPNVTRIRVKEFLTSLV